MPPTGFLNDPNGLIQFKGKYHIFFQWNPYKTEHGTKYWGHYWTEDFIHWKLEKPALRPGAWYDKNGCYSGSAVEYEGKLYLFYTGNVKSVSEDRRYAYQCLAVSEDGIHFEKKGPVIYTPDGYTSHFRDPKVWKKDGLWYMVLGAQNLNLEGNVVLYRSANLTDWTFLGPIAGSNRNGLNDFGYMWECPDLFQLDGTDILLVCPQGIQPKGWEYQNKFQSGYFVGKLDYRRADFRFQSFKELDRGFDFYAPQTMEDRNGRRILIGWLGMSDEMEQHIPTIPHNWLHMLTIPRQLKLANGRLYQIPIEELHALRDQKLISSRFFMKGATVDHWQLEGMKTSELNVTFHEPIVGTFELTLRNQIRIQYDPVSKRFTLERTKRESGEKEQRHCHVKALGDIRIFMDTSAIEIFVNEGEEVFSARYFAEPDDETMTISSESDLHVNVEAWKLKPFVIDTTDFSL